ncbi:MAG TPA: TonB-dependent receptor [Steroidobacteraceae bacterium]|nr:TonB-dependent receptor [Steroidobacteraceae bacterium]
MESRSACGRAFVALGIVSGVVCGLSAARADEDTLTEVLITASLRQTPASQLPESSTVLPQQELAQAGVEHFGDVLALVPNLGAAGGTSRPRYFQLRGVGEEEQYQGAPNPSVGFLIDGIDYSGVGMPATLFDTQQIEVLRGPQGTAYGANALAGLISVRTRDPGQALEVNAEATLGDYDTRGGALAVGDADAAGDVGWRVVAQQYRSDGFRRNVYLGRDDTNGYDEGLVRGKLFLKLGDDWRADLVFMHADLDNGYDAWSIDNSRTTETDQPGRDAQLSNGAAVTLRGTALPFGELQSITSASDSHIVFSYDGDWGNDAFWAAQPACVPDPSLCVPYDFYERTLRHRRTLAEDLRLIGPHWVVGAYLQRLTEANNLLDLYNGAVYNSVISDYSADNLALYGQNQWTLAPRWSLLAGARGEQRQAGYSDNNDLHFDPRNRMLGGNLSLQWQRTALEQWYLTLARGYKAGGFNIGIDIPVARQQYRPEFLWNLELGLKQRSADGRFELEADVFTMRRHDEQVSSSVQTDANDPLSYQYYTDNAARGENSGVEATLRWRPVPRWQLGANLGLLSTRYLDFSYDVASTDASGNPVVSVRDLSGRDQEYAPHFNVQVNAEYHHPSGWFGRLDAQAVDGYYFSSSHDQQAPPHRLVNARLGYERGHWSTSFWVRNVFNAYYAAHGFFFANEPPAWVEKRYVEAGDPRQLGVTLRYALGGQ